MALDFKRLATFKKTVNPTYGLIVEWEGGSAAVLWTFIDTHTAEELTAYMRTYSGREDIWVHKNRDDSLAVAIGVEPDIWPEDDEGPPG